MGYLWGEFLQASYSPPDGNLGFLGGTHFLLPWSMFLKPPGPPCCNATRAARATPPYPLDTSQVADAPTPTRLPSDGAFVTFPDYNKIYFCRTLHPLGDEGPLTGASRFLNVLGCHM